MQPNQPGRCAGIPQQSADLHFRGSLPLLCSSSAHSRVRNRLQHRTARMGSAHSPPDGPGPPSGAAVPQLSLVRLPVFPHALFVLAVGYLEGLQVTKFSQLRR